MRPLWLARRSIAFFWLGLENVDFLFLLLGFAVKPILEQYLSEVRKSSKSFECLTVASARSVVVSLNTDSAHPFPLERAAYRLLSSNVAAP